MKVLRKIALSLALLAGAVGQGRAGALARCAELAAARHAVPQEVLAAVWAVEWGDVGACNSTHDCGPMQVNRQHFAELATRGVSAETVIHDPCTNFDVAAGLLRRHYDRLHSWYAAMGRYHSATPAVAAAYLKKIDRALERQRRSIPSGR